MPDPKLDIYTSDLANPQSTTRSIESRDKITLKSTRVKVKHFLRTAPRFQTDIDLDELTTSRKDLAAQATKVSTMSDPRFPSQAFSGQWLDRNGKPLLFYLAHRWGDEPPDVRQHYISLSALSDLSWLGRYGRGGE